MSATTWSVQQEAQVTIGGNVLSEEHVATLRFALSAFLLDLSSLTHLESFRQHSERAEELLELIKK